MDDELRSKNDHETRLAVLEEQVRAFNLRLNAVSDRAYGLTGSMEGVLSGLREAREQRVDLLERVADVQETVSTLSAAAARTGVEMAFHVRRCEARSGRLEKLAWTALSAIIAVLGFLGAQLFIRLFH